MILSRDNIWTILLPIICIIFYCYLVKKKGILTKIWISDSGICSFQKHGAVFRIQSGRGNIYIANKLWTKYLESG